MKYKYLLPAAALLISAHSASAVLIASENWSSGDFAGGTGWVASTWTTINSPSISTTDGVPAPSLLSNNQNRGVSRTVNLTAHTDVTFSFSWAHRFLEAGENEGFTIAYDNGSGSFATVFTTAGSPDLVSGNPLQGFFNASVNLTPAVANTTQAIRVLAFGMGGTDFLYFDDFEVNGTLVPEPSTALLGALGVLGLLRRRR